jgi:hypothetical protein
MVVPDGCRTPGSLHGPIGNKTRSIGPVQYGRAEAPMSKKAIWFGMFVGSTIGGSVPMLWHAGMFSFSAIILSTVGGIAGIWATYRLGR